MQKVILLFAIIGAVLCQVPTNYTTLTSGVTVSGTIPGQSTTNSPYEYVGQLYLIQVPEGASLINVTLVPTSTASSDCSLDLYYRNDGFPCESYGGVFEDFFCAGASSYLFEYASSSTSALLEPYDDRVDSYPGNQDEYLAFPAGGNYYFSVIRSYSGEAACSFNIRADVKLVSNNGVVCNQSNSVSVALDDTGMNSECLQYTLLSATNVSVVTIANSSNDYVYKIQVPQGASGIQINFTSSDYVHIYAASFSISNDAVDDYTDCNEGELCTATINYPVPNAGNFYIFVTANNYESTPNSPALYFSGTLTVTPTFCPTGTGGSPCAPIIPLNVTALVSGSLSQSFNGIPYDTFVYTYFDYTQALVGYDINVYAYYTSPTSGTNADIYVYTRHNGLPTDESTPSYSYLSDINYNTIADQTPIVISTNDFLGQSGRYYFGIYCGGNSDSSSPCNVTLFANVSSIVPGFSTGSLSGSNTGANTGSISTTGSNTGSISTTGAASGAASTTSIVRATTGKPVATTGVQATTAKPVNTSGKAATTSRSTTARVTGSATTGSKVSSSAFIAPIFAMIAAIALLI